MSRFTHKPVRLGGSALLALLGAAYCLAAELGLGEALCVTNGCSLYQNFSLYGISLWHVGIATFLVLAGLSFTGRLSLALNLSRLTVLADCFLLLLMSLTSPCLACMGAAFFLAVVFYSLHRAQAEQNNSKGGPHPRSRLLAVWMLFMAAAAILAAKELAAPDPWHGPEDAPVRLYFSPHCPACLQAVEAVTASPLPVAYYPVAASLDEIKVILAMEDDLAKGVPLAVSLRKFRENPPTGLSLSLRALGTLWQILRNRADVLSLGKGSVPLLLINGVPQWGAKTTSPTAPPAAPRTQINAPFLSDPALLDPTRPGVLPASPDDDEVPGVPFDFNTNQCDETTDADCVEGTVGN